MAPISSSKKDDNGDVVRFEDRVNEMYRTLVKMFAWQEERMGKSGIKVRKRMRVHLEGWDFSEITRGALTTLHPKAATLEAVGLGWVDFMRSINAVVLLGNGFGEIMQATKHHNCQQWAQLPRNRYYLAASLADMKQIANYYGDPSTRPTRICDDLVWYHRADMFADCRREEHQHADPVQIFWPRLKKLVWKTLEPMLTSNNFVRMQDLPANGGVIFGHPLHFPYLWKDEGDPVETQIPLLLESHSSQDQDSGLGQSISSPADRTVVSRSDISSATENVHEQHLPLSDTVATASGEASDTDQAGAPTNDPGARDDSERDGNPGPDDETTKRSIWARGKSWIQRKTRKTQDKLSHKSVRSSTCDEGSR